MQTMQAAQLVTILHNAASDLNFRLKSASRCAGVASAARRADSHSAR